MRLFCAPGRAQTLGSASHLRSRSGGSYSIHPLASHRIGSSSDTSKNIKKTPDVLLFTADHAETFLVVRGRLEEGKSLERSRIDHVRREGFDLLELMLRDSQGDFSRQALRETVSVFTDWYLERKNFSEITQALAAARQENHPIASRFQVVRVVPEDTGSL